MPLRLAVRDVAFFERPVNFVRPFRFGAVVVNAAHQAFVRVEIEVEGKGRATGASAEFLVPKWFDKRAHLAPEDTVGELRRSLVIARELYLAHTGFETAFGLHAACLARQVEACAKEDIRRLPPPMARRRSTRRSWMRCCVQPVRISSTAWPKISPALTRGCRPA